MRPLTNMPTVGPPTTSQLLRSLERAETDPMRRERLFERYWGPRSAVVLGLTNAVLGFVVSEWMRLSGCLVLDYGCGVMPYSMAFELANAKIVGVDIGENPHADVRI